MNILIKTDTDSPSSSQTPPSNFHPILQKLSIKALRSAQNVLDPQLISSIQHKYSQFSDHPSNIVNFLQFFIFTMINQIDKLQQVASIDIVKEDYETLENAVQKSEAEIRKHIRIEQQLKIYLDSLQEKVDELQKKLENQENKYSQLFQTMREIQEQRKDLQKRLVRVQEQRDKSKSNSNYTTINQQAYKEYLVGRRSKGSKNRNGIDKLNVRKLSEKRDNKNTHFIEGAIQINLSNNIVVSKKNSYDQNLNRPNPISNDSSIRQLTKTVQMKQPHIPYERKPNRKISKYKTETGEEYKKEFRSNSVCN